MAQLSVTGLEQQILSQFETAQSSGISARQQQHIQFAFRDFVDYFLTLQSQAETALRIQQDSAQNTASPQAPAALQGVALHLNVQMERYTRPATDADDTPVQANHVKVSQYEAENLMARRIEVVTPQQLGDGTLGYAVTVIELVVEARTYGQQPPVANGGQVSSLPIAAASATTGQSLQNFLNGSPEEAEHAEVLMQYEDQDAMNMVEAEDQWQALQQERHLKALMQAMYQLMAYLQVQEYETAFGLSEEETKLLREALERDPAEVVQAALIQFIKKKRIELEMLRKEIQQRLAIQQKSAQSATVFAQLERLINFYSKSQKALEKKKIDVEKLKQLMGAIEQLNKALSQSEAPTSIGDITPIMSSDLPTVNAI